MSRIVQVASGQTNVDINKALLSAGNLAIMSLSDFRKVNQAAIPSVILDLGPGILMTAPVVLSSITTNAQIVATITPGFVGRISAAFAVVTTPVTTAAKLATVNVFIDQDGGGPLVNTPTASLGATGIPLTSANATPAGALVPAAMITYDNNLFPSTFIAASVITFVTTAIPTAFVEGAVMFGLLLAPINKSGPIVV